MVNWDYGSQNIGGHHFTMASRHYSKEDALIKANTLHRKKLRTVVEKSPKDQMWYVFARKL